MTALLSPAQTGNRNPLSSPDPHRIRNQGRLIDLFLRLLRLTRNRHRVCWASNGYLAGELGCSIDTVTRCINRLVELGALVVEQVVGIQRQVRVRLTLDQLKARLFPGDKSHWREAEPARRPSFAPRRAEGSADPVAEGHSKESLSGTPSDLPIGERTTTRRPAVVVPPVQKQEPDPAILQRAEAAARAYAEKHPVRCWPALLRVAIRDRWTPPAPEGPDERAVRGVCTVRAPREYLDRIAQEEAARAQKAPNRATMAQEPPLPVAAGDFPSPTVLTGRAAFRSMAEQLRKKGRS